MSKLKKTTKNDDSFSEAESISSDEFEKDENSSSESEVEKTSKKRKKKETKSKTKKSKKVEDEKLAKSKKKSTKFVIDTFDENISKDISLETMEPQRVRLASNLIIEHKIVEVKEPGKGKFKYPGLVFARKSTDGKVFEFNLHASFIPKIQQALEFFLIKPGDKNKNEKKM